jgi:tRNA (mo5U34)-methyltransferase
MQLHRKAARIVAEKGFTGLFRVVSENLLGRMMHQHSQSNPDPAIEQQKQLYMQNVKQFQDKARSLGYRDIDQYYWYHTIDLGNGLITPGDFDYRNALDSYKFPSSMAGMRVLDVGSATGFFAFEFERRGATVTSIELPSISEWDMPAGEDKELTLTSLMKYHRVDSIEGLHHYHLDGPFKLCRDILGSKMNRVYSTIYELSSQKLGVDQFDMIFVGDVLLHTFAPLKALAALAPLCKGMLVLTEHFFDESDTAEPMMLYAGGATPSLDRRTWWYPNKVCLDQMLKRLGFRTVEIVGHPDVVYRPKGRPHRIAVVHASK